MEKSIQLYVANGVFTYVIRDTDGNVLYNAIADGVEFENRQTAVNAAFEKAKGITMIDEQVKTTTYDVCQPDGTVVERFDTVNEARLFIDRHQPELTGMYIQYPEDQTYWNH